MLTPVKQEAASKTPTTPRPSDKELLKAPRKPHDMKSAREASAHLGRLPVRRELDFDSELIRSYRLSAAVDVTVYVWD